MYYDAKECGERIKKQIKAMGYTQEGFAQILNVSLSHVQKVLAGSCSCSIDLLVEISSVLNVSIDFLLLGKEKEHVEVRNDLLEIIGELSDVIKKL